MGPELGTTLKKLKSQLLSESSQIPSSPALRALLALASGVLGLAVQARVPAEAKGAQTEGTQGDWKERDPRKRKATSRKGRRTKARGSSPDWAGRAWGVWEVYVEGGVRLRGCGGGGASMEPSTGGDRKGS